MKQADYILGEELICLMHQAAARLSIEMVPILRTHDLTLPQWRMLAQLWLNGVMRVGNLSERVNMEVSSVSRNVARLETRGLVGRYRPGADKRASHVQLTEEGRRIVAAITPEIAGVQRPLIQCLTEAERRMLGRLLKRVPQIFDDAAHGVEAA